MSGLEGMLRSLARRILPPLWRARLRMAWLRLRPAMSAEGARTAAEARNFAGQEVVHDLPPIHHYWAERYLQPMFRQFGYNLQLHRHERRFKDWDCSVEGFEGIRAQDILPLLVQRFGFDLFLAWGNVIDPFIDRGFGPHFDPDRPWDRDFIDRVHARDEQELQARRITPTHMLAALRNDRLARPRIRGSLSPEACVRLP